MDSYQEAMNELDNDIYDAAKAMKVIRKHLCILSKQKNAAAALFTGNVVRFDCITGFYIRLNAIQKEYIDENEILDVGVFYEPIEEDRDIVVSYFSIDKNVCLTISNDEHNGILEKYSTTETSNRGANVWCLYGGDASGKCFYIEIEKVDDIRFKLKRISTYKYITITNNS